MSTRKPKPVKKLQLLSSLPNVDLPEITEEDNDKVLTVVDGVAVWRKPNSTGGSIGDDQVATDDEINDMFDEIFGKTESGGVIDDEDIATDEEINDMLEDVFGDTGNVTIDEEDIATDEEVDQMLDEVFGP